MTKQISLLLIILLVLQGLFVPVYADSELEIYVSTTGSDNNDGTLFAPLATLKGARDRIRMLKKAGSIAGVINVYFREGTYYFSDTVEFNNLDSGVNNTPITYKAYVGENVSFVGGVPLDANKIAQVTDSSILNRIQEEVRDKIVSINLTEQGLTRGYYGEMDYRGAFATQNPAINRVPEAGGVYYGGQRLKAARYPNDGFLTAEQVVYSGSAITNNIVPVDTSYANQFQAIRIETKFHSDKALPTMDIYRKTSQQDYEVIAKGIPYTPQFYKWDGNHQTVTAEDYLTNGINKFSFQLRSLISANENDIVNFALDDLKIEQPNIIADFTQTEFNDLSKSYSTSSVTKTVNLTDQIQLQLTGKGEAKIVGSEGFVTNSAQGNKYLQISQKGFTQESYDVLSMILPVSMKNDFVFEFKFAQKVNNISGVQLSDTEGKNQMFSLNGHINKVVSAGTNESRIMGTFSNGRYYHAVLGTSGYKGTAYSYQAGLNVFYNGKMNDMYFDGPIIKCNDSHLDRWETADNAKIYGRFEYDWQDYSVDLEKVDTINNTIEFKQAIPSEITATGKYYLYNLLEELDAPGEYYIDSDNGIMYLYPPQSVANTRMEITTCFVPLINMKTANNIIFDNINFSESRSSLINIYSSEKVKITNCILKNSLDYAVKITGGRNNGIENSEIFEVDEGILFGIGDSSDVENLTPNLNYAYNNNIHNWGLETGIYHNAINLGGVGNIVAHNEIHNAVHQAIQIYGYNNIIEYNEFYNTNTEVEDSGCIYAGQNFGLRGNVIKYNYFHDIVGKNMVMAVYLDDFFSGTHIFGNVFENITTGVFLHCGYDNTVENNIFINCSVDVGAATSAYADKYGLRVKPPNGEYIIKFYASTYDNEIWRSAFPEIFANEQTYEYLVQMHGNIIKTNVSVNSGVYAFTNYRFNPAYNTYESSYRYNIDQVGFENYESKNYALLSNSNVFNDMPEFENISFNSIGRFNAEEVDTGVDFQSVDYQSLYKTYSATNSAVSVQLSDGMKIDLSGRGEAKIVDTTEGFVKSSNNKYLQVTQKGAATRLSDTLTFTLQQAIKKDFVFEFKYAQKVNNVSGIYLGDTNNYQLFSLNGHINKSMVNGTNESRIIGICDNGRYYKGQPSTGAYIGTAYTYGEVYKYYQGASQASTAFTDQFQTIRVETKFHGTESVPTMNIYRKHSSQSGYELIAENVPFTSQFYGWNNNHTAVSAEDYITNGINKFSLNLRGLANATASDTVSYAIDDVLISPLIDFKKFAVTDGVETILPGSSLVGKNNLFTDIVVSNNYSQNHDILIAVSLYDGNKKLQKVVLKTVPLSEGINNIESNFDITDTSNEMQNDWYVKMFAFENISSIHPLIQNFSSEIN